MDRVLPIGCGLDVHKDFVTACLLTTGASGQVDKEARVFRTVTGQLQELVAWLQARGCRHVALESTGVYWKPVYNLLEGVMDQVLVVNARHVKNVPGRKTDMKDAEWLATLLQHGLLRGSFIPDKAIRELRDLTRYRTTVIRQRADACNRIQKLLENSNIKLGSVATDILGASGRDMLAGLAAGRDDPAALAELARGRLRKKIPALTEALAGVLSAAQRWLLAEQLRAVADLDEALARLDAKVAELSRPFAAVLARLDPIPGVNRRMAEVILAEIGPDMSRFPTAGHLASWAGLCPGQHESAGKRQSGRTRKGNSWLRSALVQAGWAASKAKGTSLKAQYHRVAKRRGKKRACLAVGHRILRIAYELLKRGVPYQEAGPDYYQATGKDRLKEQLVRRLRKLGYAVTVEDPTAA
jgi:transposase